MQNRKFQKDTKSRQASGLSVCLGMISGTVEGIQRVSVDNVDQVELALQRFKPKKVLIQALWMDAVSMNRLRDRYHATEFYYHIHSHIPFLVSESHAFLRLKEINDLGIGLVVNDQRTYSALSGIVQKIEFLPNIYNAKFLDINSKEEKDHVDVICAGSVRIMKNHVIQAIAAIHYADCLGKKLRFHVNMARSEGAMDPRPNLEVLFRMTKHELVPLEWMEHQDFIYFCAKMDLGLQVSMSESFNIVAADYVAAGIPMVVSEEIEWADNSCKVSHGDSNLITGMMFHVEQEREKSIRENRTGLIGHNINAKVRWERFRDT